MSPVFNFFLEQFTSTSTKSSETPVYIGISRGGSELFHFHLSSTSNSIPNERSFVRERWLQTCRKVPIYWEKGATFLPVWSILSPYFPPSKKVEVKWK